MKHVLDRATPLVDLPYNEKAWKALLPWKIQPQDLAWQDRMNSIVTD